MVWNNAAAKSADVYNALISTALDAANSRSNLNNLLSRLRDWHCPLSQFNADMLGTILGTLDIHSCTLVVAQILVDMLNLADRPEEFAFTFEHLAAETAGEYALVCGHLIAIVSEINRRMAETRQTPMTLEDIEQHKEKLGSNGNAGVRLTPLHIECLRQCLLVNQIEMHQRVADQVLQIKFDAIGNLHIQQITYKRFVLLYFLAHGTKGGLPAFFASWHARVVESNASSYTALVDSCVTRRIDLAVKLFRDMRAELISDNNLGLATRLINSLPMHCIWDQADIYSCVRLDARWLGVLLADALGRYIQEMDDSNVVLEECGGTAPFFMVVRFVDSKATVQFLHGNNNDMGVLTVSPDGSNGIGAMLLLLEHEWSSAIAAKASETNMLRQQLLELDRHLALTLEYVAHTRD
ncbi:hypothetical protein GGI25_006151 [Coemansia spiralis]|uniref:Uncharacterized protein n=2 Tax=Coemansia TaxID=4863 RepID=A0A9W8G1I9_9FUNG|nr:hypothetical protein GGI25_006151 [Coemansia spiralis]